MLFSASKQTQCALNLIVCNSEWVLLLYTAHSIWISTKVVTALFSWTRVYIASAMWNCCCLGAHSVYTMTIHDTTMHQIQHHFIWSHVYNHTLIHVSMKINRMFRFWLAAVDYWVEITVAILLFVYYLQVPCIHPSHPLWPGAGKCQLWMN